MKLILLGAPGAGKGSQAVILTREFNIPHISTGDIIRNALKNETELGLKAKEFINKGLLVPDNVVINIIKDRLTEEDCKNGFILDGFPRTVPQAEALTNMGIKIDKVLFLEASDEVILERLSGRRQCSECGAIYHIKNNPPQKDNICDKCGSELKIREDDKKETIINRLKVYYESTKPLEEYYEKKGLLARIDAGKNVEYTNELTLEALGVE
jgi:adenylate kinase